VTRTRIVRARSPALTTVPWSLRTGKVLAASDHGAMNMMAVEYLSHTQRESISFLNPD
jgi:hypothetical protein